MNTLVPHDAVTEIVDARDGALERAQRAAELLREAHALIREANDLAVRAHGGEPFTLDDRAYQAFKAFTTSSDVEAGLEAWRQTQDARIWMYLAKRTGMQEVMDHKAKQEYREMLARGAAKVTIESVWASIQGARESQALYFRRGLANAFSRLDRRFKSHDAFKLQSRIILTNVFDQWGCWNYSRRRDEVLQDVERCFAVLAGDKPDFETFQKQVKAARDGSTHHVVETRYFRVRAYQNGNVHLWVRDRELLDRVNLELAAYYGEVLPDAVRPDVDPRDARSKTSALSKDLAFYPTPSKAAREAVKHLTRQWWPSSARILEPSAGEGHLVRELLRYATEQRIDSMQRERHLPVERRHGPGWDIAVDAVEVHPGRVDALSRLAQRDDRISVREANFLQLTPTGDYDAVLMNPPFHGTHCLEHVMHAFDFLRPGGKLAAILPATAQVRETKKHKAFKAWLKGKGARWWDLPPESFAESGTRVATVVLTLERKR